MTTADSQYEVYEKELERATQKLDVIVFEGASTKRMKQILRIGDALHENIEPENAHRFFPAIRAYLRGCILEYIITESAVASVHESIDYDVTNLSDALLKLHFLHKETFGLLCMTSRDDEDVKEILNLYRNTIFKAEFLSILSSNREFFASGFLFAVANQCAELDEEFDEDFDAIPCHDIT